MVKRGTIVTCTWIGRPVRVWMVCGLLRYLEPRLLASEREIRLKGAVGSSIQVCGRASTKTGMSVSPSGFLLTCSTNGSHGSTVIGGLAWASGSILSGISISSRSSALSCAPSRLSSAWRPWRPSQSRPRADSPSASALRSSFSWPAFPLAATFSTSGSSN